MRQQGALYKKLATQIEDKDTKSITLEEKNELYSNLTSFGDTNELYIIFVAKFRGEDETKFTQYKNIVNTIAFINGQREKALINYTTVTKKIIIQEDAWNDASLKIITYVEKCISEAMNNKIKKSKDKLLSQIDDIVVEWQELESHHRIDIVKENLINPLSEICKKNFIDERALVLLNYIRKANQVHQKYVNQKNIYSKVFRYIAEATIVQCDKFEEAYNYYSSN